MPRELPVKTSRSVRKRCRWSFSAAPARPSLVCAQQRTITRAIAASLMCAAISRSGQWCYMHLTPTTYRTSRARVVPSNHRQSRWPIMGKGGKGGFAHGARDDRSLALRRWCCVPSRARRTTRSAADERLVFAVLGGSVRRAPRRVICAALPPHRLRLFGLAPACPPPSDRPRTTAHPGRSRKDSQAASTTAAAAAARPATSLTPLDLGSHHRDVIS